MKSQEKALRFFLGVNTPQGFVSRFDRISEKTGGWRTLIIKGGPGSGKSTLMKKIAEELKGEELELIHCSSDFDSLDAVICPARKFAIADGTAPHVDVIYHNKEKYGARCKQRAPMDLSRFYRLYFICLP